MTNLLRVLSYLEEYYREELQIDMEGEIKGIDVNSIAKNLQEEGKKELVKLVQFVLGAAVECPNKITYIQNIMSLDASAQKILMFLIEEVCFVHFK